MNGAHDIGGLETFGPIVPERDEPVFHAEWERRMFALSLATTALGVWNLDTWRKTMERIPPAQYLTNSYYANWLEATTGCLVRHGLATSDEVRTGRSVEPGRRVPHVVAAGEVPLWFRKPDAAVSEDASAAIFAVGQHVRTRNLFRPGHTRLPRYVRGKIGTVTAVHGSSILPDTSADGRLEAPQRVYTVTFRGPDLWGVDSDPTIEVSVEAWESYLAAE